MRMAIPFTLGRYMGKQFLLFFGICIGVMAGLVFVIDVMELIRRAASRDNITTALIIEMGIMKLPHLTERLLPFAMLIGSMLTLSKLTRSQELIVTRASGISVWQFLQPGFAVALLLGLLHISVFNPLSSVMLSRFEHIEARYLHGRTSMLAVSGSGLWLRQSDSETAESTGAETIIHALRVDQNDMRLFEVTMFTYDEQGTYLRRLDAKQAQLQNGHWLLKEVQRFIPGMPLESMKELEVPTHLNFNQIQDSFSSPETMSFWALPGFIRVLEEAGFSGMRHRMHWHRMLSSPLMLCAMVGLAALFSLRFQRHGKTTGLVVSCVLTGFFIYFMTDLTQALGLSGKLPPFLAAWSPAIVAMLASVWALLHLEDG